SGFMSFYVFEYLDSHRDLYNDLTSDEFQQTVFIDDQTVDDFIYYADEKGLKIDLDPYREDLKLHIKAILAEQLYDENIKQQILSQDDPMIEAVLHLIEEQIDRKSVV